MKKKFSGYYNLSGDEFEQLWEECVFSFDTSVLLNLYRYSQKTSNELLNILDGISTKIWIPYQVGFEYHRNRLKVINDQVILYSEIVKHIEKALKDVNQLLSKRIGKNRHPLINIEEITKEITKFQEDIISEIRSKEESHPDLLQEDSILEKLTSLFEDRVGNSYSVERLNEVFSEGSQRYDKKTPPGFMDQTKSEDEKYGDLIIWYQLIDFSIKEKKPIIFVIDDRKEDWWQKVSGRTIGPRPELLQEFLTETGERIYLYSSDRFMELSQDYLGSKVDQNSISEIQRIMEEIEKISKLETSSEAIKQSSYQMKLINEMNNSLNEIKMMKNIINQYDLGKDNQDLSDFDLSLLNNYPDALIQTAVEQRIKNDMRLLQSIHDQNDFLDSLSKDVLNINTQLGDEFIASTDNDELKH